MNRITDIIISDYAYNQAEKALGVNADHLYMISESAINAGMSYFEIRGKIRGFIDSCSSLDADNIKLFGPVVFFFKNKILVNIIAIPGTLKSAYENLVRAYKYN